MKIGNIDLGDFPLLLAPMEDVSDPPFRSVCKVNGADLMYTEFISSEGLIRDAEKSVQKLDIYDSERPIGIQIFGDKIESMALSQAHLHSKIVKTALGKALGKTWAALLSPPWREWIQVEGHDKLGHYRN